MNNIQAMRGMNDHVPPTTRLWQHVETLLQRVLDSFGYQEIRLPLLEKTELFKRSIGDVTDIVEKEMFTFLDRDQTSVSLRPEGTAGCVRAGIENGLLYHQTPRLWYRGPYFRHERPQKGRYRQFYQCGAEAFGMPGPDIDAEVIALSATILQHLGLSSKVRLEINSLGSAESRLRYREALIHYFTQHRDALDEDSLRRLNTNPLRILDSKNPALRPLIEAAPKLLDYLDSESQDHFAALADYLTALAIDYTINPCLVRGLDYYTKTVFEWVTDALGAQGTLCAGGRYDGLVETLGGQPTPALGFAIGIERVILLMETLSPAPPDYAPHIYCLTDSPESRKVALRLANTLRDALPGVRLLVHCGGGSFKSQFKKADKSGAAIALILGRDECLAETVSIKMLRRDDEQITLPQQACVSFLQQALDLPPIE